MSEYLQHNIMNKCQWIMVGHKHLCGRSTKDHKFCLVHREKNIISKACEKCGCGTQSKFNVCRKNGCGYDKIKRTIKKMEKNIYNIHAGQAILKIKLNKEILNKIELIE